jgi:SAM-dependent methyltransferase
VSRRTSRITSHGYSRRVPDRSDLLLASIDVAASKGLELGPLTKPVVARHRGDIRYIDHVDTEALRARYASHDGFDVDAIVAIDYASGDRSIAEAVGADAPFDYVVASHVVEHVPDLVRWFADVRSVLRDGGVLALAVPDHRCCFDALRSPTVPAEAVEAHLRGAVVPSPRQVFDHYHSAVSWRGVIAWSDEVPPAELAPVHSEREAYDTAAMVAATGAYHDVHCWVFTPRSFCALVASLQQLQLVPFSIEACSDSIGGEFFVTLRAATVESAVVAPSCLDVTVPPPGRASETARVRSELREATARSDHDRAALAAVHASRSWRLICRVASARALARRLARTALRRSRGSSAP